MTEEKNEIIEQSGGKFSFKKIGRDIKKGIKTVDKKIDKTIYKTGDKIKKTVYQTGDKIKETAFKGIDLLTRVVNNPPIDSPFIKQFLQQHGGKNIKSIVIARSPVPILIRKMMLALSNSKNRVLYHLYIIVTLNDNTKFLIEKNEKWAISKTIPKPSHTLPLNEKTEHISLQELITNTKKVMGNKFYSYNASSNNCQNFIINILQSNSLLNNQKYTDFIKQDTSDIFDSSSPWLRKLSNSVVGLAARFNILSGGHLEENKISTNIRKMNNPWLIHVQQFRKQNPHLSYKQVLQQAKTSYKKK